MLLILSVSATIFTLAMFFSSLSIGWRFVKKRKTGSISVYPFLATFINCLLWLQYGILREDVVLIIVNAVGILTSGICTLVYHHYTVKKDHVENRILLLIIFICGFLLHIKHLTAERAVTVLGLSSSLASICMYAAPLITTSKVISTGSTASLSLPLSSTSFINCVLWFAYGYALNDHFIVIPNALGALLAGSQLALFVIYGRSIEQEGTLHDM
ncbi:Sugar transporter [Basidiobolus ranarum]|uniref:Sugar transporter n=1 Tax=Basidiobolus ranarum TaxID=34480 RepID=A0ABR2WPD8_9FUNG